MRKSDSLITFALASIYAIMLTGYVGIALQHAVIFTMKICIIEAVFLVSILVTVILIKVGKPGRWAYAPAITLSLEAAAIFAIAMFPSLREHMAAILLFVFGTFPIFLSYYWQ